MNYLLELQRDPKATPISYWKIPVTMRSFALLSTMLAAILLRNLRLCWLVAVLSSVDENLTYDILYSSEDNLWSMLYLTGYLTKARADDYKSEIPKGMVALMIPNAEIKEIFETTVIRWFDNSAKKWNRNALFDAVWNSDSMKISNAASEKLLDAIAQSGRSNEEIMQYLHSKSGM